MSKHATRAQFRKLWKSVSGRTEHPANSNHIFVWVQLIKAKIAAPYFDRQPYCAAGRTWLLWKLKVKLPNVSNPFYNPSRVQWARSHGRFVPREHIHTLKTGDEVFYAFTAAAQRSGLAEHDETLTEDIKPGATTMRTFGFNTSSGRYGSQDNGGGCFPRTRPIDVTVLGGMRYHDVMFGDDRRDGPKQHAPGSRKVKRNPFAKALRNAGVVRQGDRGDAVRAVQWAVGVPVDGVFGPDTDNAVRHFQRYHVDRHGQQLIPDGEVGRLTREQLLKITHHQH